MSDRKCAQARIRELESQLIEVSHNYQRLQDETQWAEGNVTLCGQTMQLRWRGMLFLTPPEPEPCTISTHVTDRDDPVAPNDFLPDRDDCVH